VVLQPTRYFLIRVWNLKTVRKAQIENEEGESVLKTTKNVYAAYLKQKLETKTLDHITVTDIVQECGTTRQAFYYHFNDIYALLEWIYQEEAVKLLNNNRSIDTWQRGYRLILEWIMDNKQFVMNTYRSINRDYLENFMFNWFYPLLLDVTKTQAEKSNVSEENKAFIARFYTFALIAISLDWVQSGMKKTSEQLAMQVELTIKDCFRNALERYNTLA
jgi:probable dihydroxyacetone kinase regulator